MRSLEELMELAKPALNHEELIGIARSAESNTEAKQRALVFTKEHGLDERIAMSCRWLKMLRDRLDQKEFAKFVHESTDKKEREMSSQTTLSKTEQYNLQLDALLKCADPDISWRAKQVKDLGFDPTRIEKFLGVDLISKPGATVCAHCPACHDFVLPLSLKTEGHRQNGALRFSPMGKMGFTLEIGIGDNDLCWGVSKDFWVDKIEMQKDSVVFSIFIFRSFGYWCDKVSAAQKVFIKKGITIIQGERPYISFVCETTVADSWVAEDRWSFSKLYPPIRS